jgi:hypothetical protein
MKLLSQDGVVTAFNLCMQARQTVYAANAEGLIEFLQKDLMPSYERRRNELENRPQIRPSGRLSKWISCKDSPATKSTSTVLISP